LRVGITTNGFMPPGSSDDKLLVCALANYFLDELIVKVPRKVRVLPYRFVNNVFELIGQIGAGSPRDPPRPSVRIPEIPRRFLGHPGTRIDVRQARLGEFIDVPPTFDRAPVNCLHDPVMFGGNVPGVGHCGHPCRGTLLSDQLHFLVDHGSAFGAHHLRLQDLAVLLELKTYQHQTAKDADVGRDLKPAGEPLYIHATPP
jgi:hypothetical protein